MSTALPSTGARRLIAVGDPAPDFALADTVGRAHRLSDFRGSPVVLAFPARAAEPWDPARAEYVDAYNRLVARMPGGPGARLLRVGGGGETWRELTFADAAVSIPLVAQDDAAVAAAYGVTGEPAVFVLDEAGTVRWRSADALPHPDEVAAALASLAPDAPAAGDARELATQSTDESAAWSRRAFVATLFGASLALALAPERARAARPSGATAGGDAAAGDAAAGDAAADRALGAAMPVTLHVNGRDVTLQLEPRVSLLDALREYAGLTGTKKGCDHGQCGACTVHVEGRRVLSCLSLAVMQQGKAITTIEGLAPVAPAQAAAAKPEAGQSPTVLHPMQQAFLTHDGYQCGYCTPGQIMSAVAVTREPWGPDDADVREAMSGNICRCGAYPGIVAAIQEVRGHTAMRTSSSDTTH